jgi:methyltransferase (TIGR00027 family)
MVRTDDDTWDITEGVGTIALGMAAARAAETASARPLVEDPYAIMFLDAAGDGFWNALLAAASTGKLGDIDPELPRSVRAMFDYVAVRTVFFDDFFTAAAASGIRQAVILGSGLDARAWRLRWPDGTTVYEIDRVKLLKFKSVTLATRAARPAARLVNVVADLRHHWPQALRRAGHEPASPTAWSAEGLLAFLPPDAQDQLFHHMQDLSAPGSWIAAEAVNTNFDTYRAQLARLRAAATKLSRQKMPDTDDLWFVGDRTDVSDWLRRRGWAVCATTPLQLLDRENRMPAAIADMTPRNLFISARLLGRVVESATTMQ